MMWAGRDTHLPQGNARKPFSSAVSIGENLPEAASETENKCWMSWHCTGTWDWVDGCFPLFPHLPA